MIDDDDGLAAELAAARQEIARLKDQWPKADKDAFPDGKGFPVTQESYNGLVAQVDELCRFYNDMMVLAGFDRPQAPSVIKAALSRRRAARRKVAAPIGTPIPSSIKEAIYGS